jgi:hypothetical protein
VSDDHAELPIFLSPSTLTSVVPACISSGVFVKRGMSRMLGTTVLSILGVLVVLFAGDALAGEAKAPVPMAYQDEHVVMAPGNWAWD